MNRSLPVSVRDLMKDAPLLNAQAVINDNLMERSYGGLTYMQQSINRDIARSMTNEIEKIVPVVHDYDVARRHHLYTMTAIVMTQAELEVLLARAYELGKAGK